MLGVVATAPTAASDQTTSAKHQAKRISFLSALVAFSRNGFDFLCRLLAFVNAR